jgi:AcrR family transcriptional regulator
LNVWCIILGMETNPKRSEPVPAGPGESIWTRAAPKRRTTLSRDAIVRAAIAVADADGLDGVSLRRVANDLGTRPMSLYTYMDSKDDLLALMADAIVAEFLAPDPLPQDWREAILLLSHHERAAILRHPWMIQLASRGDFTAGPNGLRHYEQTLAALAGLGADLYLKLQVVEAVTSYVTGFAYREIRRRQAHIDAVTPEGRLAACPGVEVAGAMRSGYAPTVATGELTRSAPLLETGTAETTGTFEQGLSWLLAGISSSSRGHVVGAGNR